jgi:4-amino-4-deoxy-L-arabinose transferase-like glycosyltransferase
MASLARKTVERREALLLTLILAVAAVLRLEGLAWGLRHPPHVDEQPFVHWTLAMLGNHDLDHRYYEYPGLLFYLLAPALWLCKAGGPSPYLAGRVLVVAFSLVSVVLVYRIATRLFGSWAGVTAAALLAVSPTEVRLAHMIRPDVVLETFVLLALLAALSLGPSLRTDAVAGIAVGAAVALKFTGVLVATAYIVARLLRPAGRPWRVLLAGGASILAFGLLSPYSFLHARAAWQGALFQATWHYYENAGEAPSYLARVAGYGLAFTDALGVIGIGLTALGMLLWRREWRLWLPLAAFPLASIVVLATADVHRQRFIVPALGVPAILAGAAIARLALRSRFLAGATAVAAIAVPAVVSAVYVNRITAPSTRDEAATWIESHVPDGARVLTTWAGDVGLDPHRYLVVHVDRLQPSTWRTALNADVVVAGPTVDDGTLLERLELLTEIQRRHRESGMRVSIFAVPSALRNHYEPAPLRSTSLTRDHSYLEFELAERRRIGCIDVPGAHPLNAALLPVAWLSLDGARWKRVSLWNGRRADGPQQAANGRLFLLEPMDARWIRISLAPGGSETPTLPPLEIEALPR